MFKNLFKIILLLIFSFSLLTYSEPSDTITYRRRRGSFNEDALLDVASGAQRIITIDRSNVHNYAAYSYNKIDTLADGEQLLIGILTGNNNMHLKSYSFWSEKSPNIGFVLEKFDTVALSSDTVVPQNRNRKNNSNNILFSSGLIVTDSVDTAGLWTNLQPTYFGGGSSVGQSSLAGVAPKDYEWVFGHNTYIIIGFKNVSTATAKASIEVIWCECK